MCGGITAREYEKEKGARRGKDRYRRQYDSDASGSVPAEGSLSYKMFSRSKIKRNIGNESRLSDQYLAQGKALCDITRTWRKDNLHRNYFSWSKRPRVVTIR